MVFIQAQVSEEGLTGSGRQRTGIQVLAVFGATSETILIAFVAIGSIVRVFTTLVAIESDLSPITTSTESGRKKSSNKLIKRQKQKLQGWIVPPRTR